MGLIRLLLSMSVLINHCGGVYGVRFVQGPCVVQAFYVISGFYISLVINEKYKSLSSWRMTFWTNRYLRLAPSYILVTLLSFLVITLPQLNGAPNPYLGASLWVNILGWLSQITLIGQDIWIFFVYNMQSGVFSFTPYINSPQAPDLIRGYQFLQIQQGWSIGLEMWFYILAPFLVVRKTFWLVVLILASFGIRALTYYGFGWHNDPWTYRFFPSEVALFLFGTVSYHIYKKVQAKANTIRIGKILLAIILFIGLTWVLLPMSDEVKGWIYVLAMMFSIPYIFAATKKNERDRWIGNLSYPIYISHILIMHGLIKGHMHFVPDHLQATACVILTFLASAAVNHWLDEPIDRYRQRLAKKREA